MNLANKFLKNAPAAIQIEGAILPTRGDLKDSLLKVEDEITRKLTEKYAIQKARIKEIEERL